MSAERSCTAAVPRALRGTAAVVFDTDGVITDSARVHAAAWKTAFDAVLSLRGQRSFDAEGEYLRYVDGRSRLDGARVFLESRGLHPSEADVQAVAADKERLFTEAVRDHGIDAYPGTVRLLGVLRSAGLALAAASASRHARELLEHAGVRDLFDTLVDGTEAARLHLPGKPDPALFLEAARRLGIPAARAAVVEDALAGVEAGRRGGFAVVIGVDRAHTRGTRAGLLEHGADLVVDDLAELLASEDRR
ncbi:MULTISPECIES: HAD family hydrolase [Streptomyces]|uniref:Beta-phosphoglucomutase n=1 Tax=Streptomyces dengpaensis TaxID=2049881 RepID=A0ABM6SZL0_9ACTN|nr:MULTISPECIES: beta-phosphoglucomutase family hydrolase [Streptomyces]AVH60140.1 beta-phosphoglucomutase family hydrolase [Streptomyces dengpaensis]PIB04688.1 hydrolase [Streptomyces sp. HG99]